MLVNRMKRRFLALMECQEVFTSDSGSLPLHFIAVTAYDFVGFFSLT